MNSILLLFFGTLCSLGLTYQVNEKEHLLPKLPLRPGDLLRSLDALTSDAQVFYTPLQETPLKQAERRVYYGDDSLNDNQKSGFEYDYDKAYENFVSKYFAKGEEELESDETSDDEDVGGEKAEDIDEAAPYEHSDGEVEYESKEEAKSSSSGSKRCERVKIDNQNCKICEDPITNEKSKTCSYSSDVKPKNYGYSKEKSTKNSSDNEDENDNGDDHDDKSSEIGRSFKRETSQNKKTKFQPRRTSIEQFLKPSPEDTSKCTRKIEDGMICFYCGSALENTRECITDKNNLKKRRLDESSKKNSALKKVFKRMVTYSFKNDAEPKFKKNTYSAFRAY